MASPQGRFLEGKNILLAYERKLTSDLVFSVLKQCGAGPTISGAPSQMMVRLKDFKPDIIICEYAMEVVTGAVFVGFIRKEMKITAPVVMLIHRGDTEAGSRSRAIGVEQMVTVPFATIDLMKALSKVSATEVTPAKRDLYFGE
jgi:DNA-binding response OmpR family regulator